jgi:uncharacterized DUF497 family protein
MRQRSHFDVIYFEAMRRVDIAMSNHYNIIIRDVEFEWDIDKNNSNYDKHGIRFEQAATAFLDPFSEVYFDPEHSESEDRYLLIGYAASYGLLVVCHCYRSKDEVVRMISARKATESESTYYGR